MPEDYTVRVHCIDGSERIVPAKDIHNVGEEGARSATAVVDGCEVTIYNRVEYGYLCWLSLEKSEPACFDKTSSSLVNYRRSRSSRAALPGSRESGVC